MQEREEDRTLCPYITHGSVWIGEDSFHGRTFCDGNPEGGGRMNSSSNKGALGF